MADQSRSDVVRWPLDLDGDDPVLRLLAPLTAAYIERVDPHRQVAVPVDPSVPVADGGAFIPCLLWAVVSVDPEGRVPWRFLEERDRRRAAAVDAAGDTIRITVGGRPGAALVAPDRQGRLRIPKGLLHVAGLSRGDRLAVLQLDDTDFVLAPTTSVGLRSGGA